MPFALQILKKWGIQPMNPTLQFKQPATWEIFATQLKRRWDPYDEPRNHKLQPRKYEVLNYKNENTKNLWQKYHKSHQRKEFCFFGIPKLEQLLSMKEITIEEQRHKISSKEFYSQSQMDENYNGQKWEQNGTKSKKGGKNMRDCNPNE